MNKSRIMCFFLWYRIVWRSIHASRGRRIQQEPFARALGKNDGFGGQAGRSGKDQPLAGTAQCDPMRSGTEHLCNSGFRKSGIAWAASHNVTWRQLNLKELPNTVLLARNHLAVQFRTIPCASVRSGPHWMDSLVSAAICVPTGPHKSCPLGQLPLEHVIDPFEI